MDTISKIENIARHTPGVIISEKNSAELVLNLVTTKGNEVHMINIDSDIQIYEIQQLIDSLQICDYEESLCLDEIDEDPNEVFQQARELLTAIAMLLKTTTKAKTLYILENYKNSPSIMNGPHIITLSELNDLSSFKSFLNSIFINNYMFDNIEDLDEITIEMQKEKLIEAYKSNSTCSWYNDECTLSFEFNFTAL